MLGCKDAALFVLPASNVPLHVTLMGNAIIMPEERTHGGHLNLMNAQHSENAICSIVINILF
jgi:hypothetical protein